MARKRSSSSRSIAGTSRRANTANSKSGTCRDPVQGPRPVLPAGNSVSQETCMNGRQPVLELKGLSKSFGGLRAVRDVDLQIFQGDRKAIIGPNGAGKTTLFNVITGIFP